MTPIAISLCYTEGAPFTSGPLSLSGRIRIGMRNEPGMRVLRAWSPVYSLSPSRRAGLGKTAQRIQIRSAPYDMRLVVQCSCNLIKLFRLRRGLIEFAAKSVRNYFINRTVKEQLRAADILDLIDRIHLRAHEEPRKERHHHRCHIGNRGETGLNDQPGRVDLGRQIHSRGPT